MTEDNKTRNIAMFCDFENIALGVRDAKYDRFDLKAVLGRVLLKGNIVVKKAYADWESYKDFKPAMHEAAFELIEIPHVRQSGKNSADIRMVVDALDLCYTKSHLDTFVILSGDSDFSPLVSKLRENNKYVVGIGVKSSTSDLLSGNCDEFIYYDDLARPKQKAVRKKKTSRASSVSKTGANRQDEQRRQEAIDLVLTTVEGLFEERGEEEKVWGSMVKQTMRRVFPSFNEASHGYTSFTDALEDVASKGRIQLELDEQRGNYIVRSVRK